MAKLKVFMTRNDFPQNAINILADSFDVQYFDQNNETQEDFLQAVNGVYGIFCIPPVKIDETVLNAAGSSLKVISSMSVGYEHLSVNAIKTRGIRIGYCPEVLTEAVAEMAISLSLATSRRVLEGNKEILLGNWGPCWSPLWMCGYGLKNSVVGIIGAGNIGSSIAQKVKAFNISQLLYTNRSNKKSVDNLGGVKTDIDDLIRRSDFVFISLSLSAETKHIINRDLLSKMKPTAILVNTGRGELIDQDALVDALKNKRIGGVGLDVTTPEPLPKDHPLLQFSNAVVTPHIASATYSTRYEMAEVTAKNIVAVFQGKKMVYEL